MTFFFALDVRDRCLGLEDIFKLEMSDLHLMYGMPNVILPKKDAYNWNNIFLINTYIIRKHFRYCISIFGETALFLKVCNEWCYADDSRSF